ncbi:hypothetical protein KM043_018289 [Ampulex compressa]|nr:hypothetical protein KM043_018289 [Ampulex compressa]
MQKFKKAQAENRIAIERHLEANSLLDSSSDEEEEGNDIHLMVDKVLSVYEGEEADTERVLSFLINNFQSGGAVCLICISTVRNTDPIWNCNKCYCFLHLTCTLHWIRDSLGYKREKGILQVWACPKCRMEYGQDQIPQCYECFCVFYFVILVHVLHVQKPYQ